MAISAEQIVDMFEEDVKARRRLAAILVLDPEIRLAIINAVLKEVATKQDLEKLRDEIKSEISELRSEMRVEIDRLYRLVFTSLIGIMLSIVVTVLVRVFLP